MTVNPHSSDYQEGFRAAVTMLEGTEADTLADAIDEATEAYPDEPWPS